MARKGRDEMIITFFLDRYFTKIDDVKFERLWETKILTRLRYLPLTLMVYYILGVWVISSILLIGNESFLIGMLTFALVALFYGYLLLRTILRFYGKCTTRFLLVKSGQGGDTFDKSNVIN